MNKQQLELFTNEFQLTEVGLEITGTPDFEDWMDYGQTLKTLDGTVRQFAIGDWIVHGFGHYQHGKWEAVEQVWADTSVATLQNYEWVAKNLESFRRLKDLSWSHHQIVASIDPDKQQHWLKQAADKKWSVATLRQKISESTHITLIKGNMLEVLPDLGMFDLVVADPPYGIDYNDVWDDRDAYQPERWLKVVLPHLADEYNMFWFCSPKLAADMDFRFKAFDLPIQSRIVWHRRNMAMGSKATNRFVDSWEMIFHIGNRNLNFPDEWSDAWFDVQTFAVPQTNFTDRKLHPTQKPEGLIERLVAFGSYPGDRILDPFSGAGTTGAVCPDDRECTLVESEEGYVGITEGRLSIKRQT